MKKTKKLSFIKKLKFYLLALTISGLLVSCGTNKKQDETANEEFDKVASELTEKVKKVINQIPPPSQLPSVIQSTGANFNPDLINDLNKAKKYTTNNNVAALNLGIYATDIGYLVIYEKVQDALNYMEVCLELGESIGIQHAIDLKVVKNFESNLDNKDTLAAIINNVIQDSDDFLNENERSNIAALIISGTFVEGLYIATHLVDTYPKDLLSDDARNLVLGPLIKLIIDQEKPLADMIDLLKSIDEKGDWIEGLINSLEELKENYEALEIQDQISNNLANMVLTDKTLEKITLQIKKIRATVTY